MAKITVKRLLKEDLQRDTKEALPSWLDDLIYVFNLFLDQVVSAFNRGLTFTDNIQSQIYEFKVTTDANYTTGTWTTQSFKWSFPASKPQGVIVLTCQQTGVNYTPIYKAVYCDWLYINGSIEIRYVAGLQNSASYNVKVLVI